MVYVTRIARLLDKTAHRRRQAYGDRWEAAMTMSVVPLLCLGFSMPRQISRALGD